MSTAEESWNLLTPVFLPNPILRTIQSYNEQFQSCLFFSLNLTLLQIIPSHSNPSAIPEMYAIGLNIEISPVLYANSILKRHNITSVSTFQSSPAHPSFCERKKQEEIQITILMLMRGALSSPVTWPIAEMDPWKVARVPGGPIYFLDGSRYISRGGSIHFSQRS